MPSCDLLQVTDSTTGAPVGEEELCHEGKHFHSMSRQATKIALETSLPVLSSRSWPTYDACIIEVLPKWFWKPGFQTCLKLINTD